MRYIRRHRPSPALAVASLALFVAIGGTSWAMAMIGSAQIIDNSLRSVDVKDNDVRSADLRNNDVRSADIRDGSLRAVDFRAGVLTAGPAGPRGVTGAAGASGVPGQQGPQGPAGPASPTSTAMYAHVDATGAIDLTRTTAGINVTRTTYANYPVYCFQLPQPAANISVTAENTFSTSNGSTGFALGPVLGTVVASEIATYACPVNFRDAAAVVPGRPGVPDTPLYAAFQ